MALIPTPVLRDADPAKNAWRCFANAQLAILKNWMQLQGLKCGQRVIELSNGVIVTIVVNYLKEDIFVNVPTVPKVLDIVNVTMGSFISNPRLYGLNDGYRNKVAIGNGNLVYPLLDSDNASAVFKVNKDNSVSVSRQGHLYGNVDWKGKNTIEAGKLSNAPVLTWKGPTGRTIPFDYYKPIDGLTTPDIMFSGTSVPYYTCFGPNIYQSGAILSQVPTIGDVEPKVLGAALTLWTNADNTQYLIPVCIVNNHYADKIGFFDEVWVKYKADGWLKIHSEASGRPTQCWFFSEDGIKATRGLSEYTINVKSRSVSLKHTEQTYIEYTLDNSSTKGDHSTKYKGSTTVWSDYKGNERVFAKIFAAGGHAFTPEYVEKATMVDAQRYSLGEKPIMYVTGPDIYAPPSGGTSYYSAIGGIGTITITEPGASPTPCSSGGSPTGTVTATSSCGQTATKEVRLNTVGASWKGDGACAGDIVYRTGVTTRERWRISYMGAGSWTFLVSPCSSSYPTPPWPCSSLGGGEVSASWDSSPYNPGCAPCTYPTPWNSPSGCATSTATCWHAYPCESQTWSC